VDRMACWPVDEPLILAFLVVLVGKWESGVLAVDLPKAWWALLWVGPTLYITLWALKRADQHRLGAWTAAIPPLVFVGMCLLECTFGRTNLSPWWLTHFLIGVAL